MFDGGFMMFHVVLHVPQDRTKDVKDRCTFAFSDGFWQWLSATLHGNYNTLPYPAQAVAVLSLRLVAQIMKVGTQKLDADSFAKFVPMIVDTKYHERPGAVERINAVYRRKLKNIRFSNPVLCH